MGWVCTYTPLELIYAAGFLPYRIVGHSDPIEHADSYISPNFCQFVKSTIDVAIEGGYEFLEGVVFVNSCDAMRRLHDVWKRYVSSKFTYIIDIPMGHLSLGHKYLRDEFEKLKIALENYASQKINNEIIEQSIDTYVESRSLFQSMNSLRLKNPSQINGINVSPTTWQAFTFPFNFTGHPAATIPCGWTDDNLPIGLQIVGKRFQELLILQASKAFEEIAPWQDKKPKV